MIDAPKDAAAEVKVPTAHQEIKKPDTVGPAPVTTPAAQPAVEKK